MKGSYVWWLLGLVAIAAWLRPSSCLPVNERELKLKMWEKESQEKGRTDLCILCEGAVDVVLLYMELTANASVHELFPVLEPICVFFLNQRGLNGPYMCPGIIFSYGPVVLDVIAKNALQPSDICYILHFCNREQPHPSPALPHLSSLRQSSERDTALLKSSVHHSGGRERGRNKPHSEGGGRMQKVTSRAGVERGKREEIVFLQLSDIHLDRQYSEGSPTMCNLYICCRSWYNGTGPAGHYGNYQCDLPLATLDLVVETIAQLDPQPDFIIYTGDNPPHDLWNETWTSQTDATAYLVSYLAEKLPNRRIYPALGNHETFPESEYLGTLPQYQELTSKMAEYWQTLAPLPQTALDTIRDGAYYTLLIQDKLRVLSFNSDYGYTLNFYSSLNSRNPYYSKQQAWIIDTLQQAEEAGEKVIMIAHIPPGSPGNTLKSYDEFYLNITKRYCDTIVGHLYGHTHHDEFKLIQDKDGVYGTVMVCPSVTPQGRSNPSFRLFTMDASTLQLQGYQQYHLNLTLANEMAARGEKPKMELAYTTSDFYHLTDLTPASWTGLVERFSQFPDLVSEYRYNKYGRSSSHDQSCDSQCVHETICTVSNIIDLERLKCIYQQ